MTKRITDYVSIIMCLSLCVYQSIDNFDENHGANRAHMNLLFHFQNTSCMFHCLLENSTYHELSFLSKHNLYVSPQCCHLREHIL